jgi:hypothetical protein
MAPKSPAGFLMLAPSSDFTITSCTIDGNQANQPGATAYSQATVKWTGTGYFRATGNVFQNGGGENLYLGDVSSQICPREILVDYNKFLNLIGHGGSSGLTSDGVFIVCNSAQTGISSSIEIHFNKFLQSTPALNGTFPIEVAGNPPVRPPSSVNLSASITDNEFDGCGDNNQLGNPGGCITLYYNAGRTEIANNRFFNFVNVPISVSDSPMVDIHDNVIDGPAMSLISGNGYLAGAAGTINPACIFYVNFERPPFYKIGNPAYGATIHDNIIGNKYSLGCPGAGIQIEGESTSWVADSNYAVGQMVRPDAAAPVPQQPYMFQVTAATGGSCLNYPPIYNCGNSDGQTQNALSFTATTITFPSSTPAGVTAATWASRPTTITAGAGTPTISVLSTTGLKPGMTVTVFARPNWPTTLNATVTDNQLTWKNIGPVSDFPSRVSVSHNIIENSCMGVSVHGVGSISLDSNQINGSFCTTPQNFSSIIFSDVFGDIDFYHNKIRNGIGYGVLADNIQTGDSQLAKFYLKDNEFESNGIAGSGTPGDFNDVRLHGIVAGPQLASLQGNTFLGPYITQSILITATTTNLINNSIFGPDKVQSIAIDAMTTNLINNTIPLKNTVSVGGPPGATRTDSGNSFDGGPASGLVSVNASTSGSTTFPKTYANAPSCTLTPKSDPTTAGIGSFWATSTTDAVMANVHNTGTIVFIYHCDGF